jgi:cytochrome c556
MLNAAGVSVQRPTVRFNSVLVAGLLVFAGACARTEPPPTDLVRSATIKDIMDSMVDPSGDFLFESVAEIADERGVTEKAPRTDEEWAQVRRHALVLLEAPNLLAMEGRRVARPHERSKNPQVELQPEEIQKSVDGDRPGFIRRAQKLQESAEMVLRAVDSRDTTALFHAIEGIDRACENCHLHYWYPNDHRAQEAAREQGLVD